MPDRERPRPRALNLPNPQSPFAVSISMSLIVPNVTLGTYALLHNAANTDLSGGFVESSRCNGHQSGNQELTLIEKPGRPALVIIHPSRIHTLYDSVSIWAYLPYDAYRSGHRLDATLLERGSFRIIALTPQSVVPSTPLYAGSLPFPDHSNQQRLAVCSLIRIDEAWHFIPRWA